MPGPVKDSATGALPPTKAKGGAPVVLPWVLLQEDAVSPIPPVPTRDGSYVFLAQASTVLIVSRLTNRVVATLSGPTTPEEHRHTAPITGMMLSTSNPLQLITSSLDGTIKTWGYLDSELHDNIQVGHAIVGMSASPHWKNRLFIAVCKRGAQAGPLEEKNKEASSTMYSVQVGRSSPRMHKATKLVRLGKTRPVSQLSVSPDGRWLVAVSHNKVHVLDLNDTGDGFTKYATESRITALAFHPDKHVARFATGEANGKIKIWHCLEQFSSGLRQGDSSSGRTPMALTTTLHWHAHAVSALQYTPDGAQLLSGGEESVLVVWKLNSGLASGADAREFVPRIGAPIVAIAVATGFEGTEQEYIVRLADGSAAFIASLTLKPTRSFSTIKSDATRAMSSAQRLPPIPLAVDRAAQQLVLPAGHPSTLQFIDVTKGAHVRDMEVVPSNRVSRPDEEVLEPPRLHHIAFSAPSRQDATHAAWMATVDGRVGGTYTTELSLKLWQWDARSQSYVLNTRIDHPHDGGVTCVAFSPRLAEDPLESFLLATAGQDGHVKTWRMAQRTLKGSRTETFWVCRSSLSYRDTQPHSLAWAPDGSLLAVAQGAFVTLWDPLTLVMQARLMTPELKQVLECDFIGRYGRYLAARGTASRLVVWDLVSQTVVWAAPWPVYGSVPYGEGLLALRADNSSSTLLELVSFPAAACTHTWSVPLRFASAPLNLSHGTSLDSLHLLGIREGGTLVGVGAAATAPAATAASLHSVALDNARATLFDELFGAPSTDEATSEALAVDAKRVQKSVADTPMAATMELFATPAHLLPPMSTLLDSFVSTLLPPRAVDTEERAEAARSSSDSPSDSAPEETPAPRLDALDHVAQARDADLSHLTVVFDRLMSEPGRDPVASAPLPRPSKSGKSKRRASKSAS